MREYSDDIVWYTVNCTAARGEKEVLEDKRGTPEAKCPCTVDILIRHERGILIVNAFAIIPPLSAIKQRKSS
jgi:hypothetical protein